MVSELPTKELVEAMMGTGDALDHVASRVRRLKPIEAELKARGMLV